MYLAKLYDPLSFSHILARSLFDVISIKLVSFDIAWFFLASSFGHYRISSCESNPAFRHLSIELSVID